MAFGSRIAVASLACLIAAATFADDSTPAATAPTTSQNAPAESAELSQPGVSTPATEQPSSAPSAPSPDASTLPSPPAAPPPSTSSPGDLATALARIDALGAQIKDLGTKLDAAEADLARTQKALDAEREGRAADAQASEALQADLFAAADEANAKTEEFRTKLEERDKLADRLAAVEAERDRLSASLDAERGGRFSLDEWPRVLLSGFAAAAPRIGSWKIGEGTASQTNAREFFSRLDIPFEQSGRAYLYRFSAQSTGTGWVGLGIHFFASGVKSKRGYGEGRSLLVWLTRDPAVRKTDATWLQLYRSDNDVVMERVLDSKLEESIGKRLELEVAYDPSSGYLSVAVDGRLAVRYRAWFGIEEGVGVSLRSLGGGVSFSDFEIRGKD